MTKMNFKEIEVTNISGEKKFTADGRAEFADILYTSCNGIAAHALALKIYNSKKAVDLTDEELALVVRVAEERCTPAFIDGIKRQLKTE